MSGNKIYGIHTETEERKLRFELSHLGNISKLSDAVKYCKSFNSAGSIVVARNAERYPLKDTALPVIKQNYARVLGFPEPELGIEGFMDRNI